MTLPKVVSRDEWVAARKRFLVKQKEFTRARDQLNAERRRLPMARIHKEYVFDGPDGYTDEMKGTTMETMTDNQWRSFVTTGTKLAHLAITRPDGRPHVTPVCFILDDHELAFALSPGSVKGKILAHDHRLAVCVSDERQPYSFVTIEGIAQLSADPDQIKRIGTGVANRYYPSQPPEAVAEAFVQEGFTAVQISITKVIARTGLG